MVRGEEAILIASKDNYPTGYPTGLDHADVIVIRYLKTSTLKEIHRNELPLFMDWHTGKKFEEYIKGEI
jgi:hypothetical protein